MVREPKLLGFDPRLLSALADYYEFTMADTNIVAGIDGKRSVFNVTARELRPHKVVWEDSFISDGHTCVVNGKKREFKEKQEDLIGKRFDLYEVEADNYFLNMGLEQVLASLTNWEMQDNLVKFFADKQLSHETVRFFQNMHKLDLTVEAIPEGIPIFPHEPTVSVEGTFEKDQFPESLILGNIGYQTAIGTNASYTVNMREEFGRQQGDNKLVLLEGGSRRCYPPVALAASRAAIAAGFDGTSLVALAQEYPELLAKIGGSSGHSEVLHVGNDYDAFDLQTRAYFRLKLDDSPAVVREKIRTTKGVGPTYLIDTFGTFEGLDAAKKVMAKYGIQATIRNDNKNTVEKLKDIRCGLDEKVPKAKIFGSDELNNWQVYNYLLNKAPVDVILMGGSIVNPYGSQGFVYKISMDQPDSRHPRMDYRCKICSDNPVKGTLPGLHDVYRIISSADEKADRDVILLRDVDDINNFMKSSDKDYIKLNQQVMYDGKLTYQVPDMCELIELRKYHMDLLRPEHKRFRNAKSYPVEISPTIIKIRDNFARKFATGKL